MVTEDMNVCEVIELSPEIEKIFLKHGMPCVGCPASNAESIREAATGHAVNLKSLMEDINGHLNAHDKK